MLDSVLDQRLTLATLARCRPPAVVPQVSSQTVNSYHGLQDTNDFPEDLKDAENVYNAFQHSLYDNHAIYNIDTHIQDTDIQELQEVSAFRATQPYPNKYAPQAN